jgi:hypothetical protein
VRGGGLMMASGPTSGLEGAVTNRLRDDLYAKLVNEEDARVCREIPESVCRKVPGNFFLLISSYVVTKLGNAVANPKTTLTWMVAAVGAPVALTGLLVPVQTTGLRRPSSSCSAAPLLCGWQPRDCTRGSPRSPARPRVSATRSPRL